MTNFAQKITLPSPCPEKMLEALWPGSFFQAVCGFGTQKDSGQPLSRLTYPHWEETPTLPPSQAWPQGSNYWKNIEAL